MNLEDLRLRVIKNKAGFENLDSDLVALEEKLQDPSVWADQKLATEIGQQVREIKDKISLFKSWDIILDDATTAFEIGDEELIKESEISLSELEKQLDKYDIQQMLSGEYDDADAFLSINAGAGGTDAQDWASMLLRMYTRWAESRNWKVELVDKAYYRLKTSDNVNKYRLLIVNKLEEFLNDNLIMEQICAAYRVKYHSVDDAYRRACRDINEIIKNRNNGDIFDAVRNGFVTSIFTM